MKIYVSRIPMEGLRELATYDPAALDVAREDIRPVAPCAVEVFAAKADQELVVNARIRCPLRLTCARCLEEFDHAVNPQAIFSYKVKPTDVIDITDDVRQEIILAYPMIPVCRVDCKGLCRTCGQNLNQASCAHGTGASEAGEQQGGGSIAV